MLTINLIKMCSSMWYMSVLALLVVDVRTGALEHQERRPRQCHVCVPGNNTSCEQSSEWSSVICSPDSPFCATITIGPNFRSSLACSAAIKTPCSLSYSPQNALSLNCVCTEHLCNVPFSLKLRNELLYISSKNNTNVNFTDTFFKMILSNVTDVNLYKRITVHVTETNKILMKNNSQLTMFSSISTISENLNSFTKHSELHPLAEALKEESTAPTDDDEDESEGSGSYEEIRSHSQPASAPAAPSSFLPANENSSPTLFYNFYITTYLIARIII